MANGKFSTRVADWFDERLLYSDLVAFLAKKTVPVHSKTWWYYAGGATLFLFLVQVLTGILLMLYYQPGSDQAYESVRMISTQVEFGWLVRSVHNWSANLMVLFAFVHLFSVFFLQAYRKPRELIWISGVLLLFVTLALGFSGYLLPWNELAFFATKVGTDIAGAVPFVGSAILKLLRGGEDVTGMTISRFYGFHVAVLPAVTAVLLALHLILVQRHGMSTPLSEQSKPKRMIDMPFFPHFALRDLLLWIVVFNVLLLLAVFFPWELGEKADPFAPAPLGIAPEWYFMFMFQTLKLLPAHIGPFEGEVVGVVAFGLAALVLLLVPFLDRRANRGERNPLFFWIGWLALIYIIVLTIWGYLA